MARDHELAEEVNGGAAVRRAQVLASRVLVVTQGGLFKSGRQYYMKEVWWDYLSDPPFGLCDSMTLVAPTSSSPIGRYRHGAVDD